MRYTNRLLLPLPLTLVHQFIWSCRGIPCQWSSTCHWRSSKTIAFCWHEDTDCPPNLQLRPQECGTVCQQTYETQGCQTPGSGGRWRRFYFDSPTTAHCELLFFNCAVSKYSYLRTYLLLLLLLLCKNLSRCRLTCFPSGLEGSLCTTKWRRKTIG